MESAMAPEGEDEGGVFVAMMRRRLEDEAGDENALVTSNDSEIIRDTLRLYGSIFLACLLTYEFFLRKRYPRLFNIRSWVDEHKCDLALKEYPKPFSWMWQVFQISDDDLMDNIGLDTLCFLRSLKFGRKLAVLGSLNAIWLIPLYRTAKESPETAYLEDPLVLISISNLPSASKRFLGTVIAAYIINFYAMHIIFEEFKWYTRFRHRFLSRKEPRNYSCYVSGIPDEYRSSVKLKQYFDRCCATGNVVEAHIAMEAHKLETRIERRDAVVEHLERLYYLESQSGKTETHRRVRLDRLDKGVEKVESVAIYENELEELNKCIEEKVREIKKRDIDPHEKQFAGNSTSNDVEDDGSVHSSHSQRYALGPEAWGGNNVTDSLLDSVQVIETKNCSDDDLLLPETKEEEENQVVVAAPTAAPEEVENSGSARSKNGLSLRSTVLGMTAGRSFDTAKESTLAAGKSIAKGTKMAGDLLQKGGDVGVKQATKTLKKAQGAGANIIVSAGAVVPILLSSSEGAPMNAGFVTFSSLFAAQTALQMIHHPEAYTMEVMPAPQPKALFWKSVGLPASARRGGRAAALAASAVLCFFWSIPMAFISSLTEINSLKETLPKFGAWIDARPGLEKLLALIAPLILLFFNETLLPSILKYFATWEGHISSAMLEASLFVKLGCFMIIQTFFVSAISGSITAELENMLENPGSIIDFLANSLPNQSSYFIQIALVSTFFLQSIELLRVYPLGMALLRRFVGPRVTEKDRRKRWGFVNSLEDPPEFWLAETSAQLLLFYLVFFVYSPIAPVTSVFLCFCFILLESSYRYQLIHNYPIDFDTGGKLWKTFMSFAMASLIIGQLTLIGLLSLKKNPYSAPALGPLLACTILFIIFMNSQHSLVANYLPTRECVDRDDENNAEGPMDTSFLKDAYLQPSLKSSEPVRPERPASSRDIEQNGHDVEQDIEHSEVSRFSA